MPHTLDRYKAWQVTGVAGFQVPSKGVVDGGDVDPAGASVWKVSLHLRLCSLAA